MKEKLMLTPTLLGTYIYAYDMSEEMGRKNGQLVYEVVHCDHDNSEKILRHLNYNIVEEREDGAILKREVGRITDIFDEGIRFGQRVLKEGVKEDLRKLNKKWGV